MSAESGSREEDEDSRPVGHGMETEVNPKP